MRIVVQLIWYKTSDNNIALGVVNVLIPRDTLLNYYRANFTTDFIDIHISVHV